MIYDTQLYKGSKESVNPGLMVTYLYDFEVGGNFPTIKEKRNGSYSINPSFGISISEGFDKPRIFIPGIRYYAFSTLFEKAIKLISENLFTIFPNVNKIEFEIDSRALERFQTEKALTTAGMSAYPAVWSDETNACYPGIRINTKQGYVTIPLEDAIPLSEMFKRFDPILYSINMLRFFGKID